MSENQKNFNIGLSYVAICLISFLLLGINAVNPALAAIGEAFPEVDATTLSMFSQIPALTTIPFLLAGGILAKLMSKKTLAIVGLICYTIGGCSGYLVDDFTIMLVGRCILGFGIGILNPVVIGLIADMYSDDNKNYTRLMGLNTAFKSAGGVFNTIVVGFLVVLGWRNAFLLYLLGIPAIIFVAIAVPNVKPKKLTAEEKAAEKANKKKFTMADLQGIGGAVISLCLLACLQSAACSTVNTNLSHLIADAGFGSSVFAGFALSAFTGGAVVGSLIYTKWGVKGNGCAWANASMVLVVLGCFCGAFPVHAVMPFLAAALVGLGNGLVKPVWAKQLTLVSINWAALFFAIYMVAQNIGTTLQAAVVPSIAQALGGTGMGATNFMVMAMFQIVVLIFCIIANKLWIGKVEDAGMAAMDAAKDEKEEAAA